MNSSHFAMSDFLQQRRVFVNTEEVLVSVIVLSVHASPSNILS